MAQSSSKNFKDLSTAPVMTQSSRRFSDLSITTVTPGTPGTPIVATATLIATEEEYDDLVKPDETAKLVNTDTKNSGPPPPPRPQSEYYHENENDPTHAQIQFNGEQILYLRRRGFSDGLMHALAQNLSAYVQRTWVVDNSGSMQKEDGRTLNYRPSYCKCFCLQTTPKDVVFTKDCSRWEELLHCLEYHIQISSCLQAPTTFRLLNSHDHQKITQFSVGKIYPEPQTSYDLARRVMSKKPFGPSSLTKRLKELQAELEAMEDKLRRTGKKVVIVLTTDGLPTDDHGFGGKTMTDEFIRTLDSLHRFPVWIVIRLITESPDVIYFYNTIDKRLEVPVEVLNDFTEEAKEVYDKNPWINYALPLQLCREMGFHHKLFDLIDERELTLDEVEEYCKLIFGDSAFESVPSASENWAEFSKAVQRKLKTERLQYCPMSEGMRPWVDLRRLDIKYGGERTKWQKFVDFVTYRDLANREY